MVESWYAFGNTHQTGDHPELERENSTNHRTSNLHTENLSANHSHRKITVETLVKKLARRTTSHTDKTKGLILIVRVKGFRVSLLAFKVKILVSKTLKVKVIAHGVKVIRMFKVINNSIIKMVLVFITTDKDLDLKVNKDTILVLLVMVSMATIKVRVSMDTKVAKQDSSKWVLGLIQYSQIIHRG